MLIMVSLSLIPSSDRRMTRHGIWGIFLLCTLSPVSDIPVSVLLAQSAANSLEGQIISQKYLQVVFILKSPLPDLQSLSHLLQKYTDKKGQFVAVLNISLSQYQAPSDF